MDFSCQTDSSGKPTLPTTVSKRNYCTHVESHFNVGFHWNPFDGKYPHSFIDLFLRMCIVYPWNVATLTICPPYSNSIYQVLQAISDARCWFRKVAKMVWFVRWSDWQSGHIPWSMVPLYSTVMCILRKIIALCPWPNLHMTEAGGHSVGKQSLPLEVLIPGSIGDKEDSYFKYDNDPNESRFGMQILSLIKHPLLNGEIILKMYLETTWKCFLGIELSFCHPAIKRQSQRKPESCLNFRT